MFINQNDVRGVIAEIGSTHDGISSECFKAIDNAKRAGIGYVKFQLLEKQHLGYGNVPFDKRILPDLIEYGRNIGIEVFASCWSISSVKYLSDCGAKICKFSCDFRDIHLIENAKKLFDVVILSSTECLVGGFVNLFCVPEYPVVGNVCFDGLFKPGKFDGFSDHTVGIKQSKNAIRVGAKIIEKHVLQHNGSQCPDAKFAVSWNKLRNLQLYMD